jgi:flagellar protein FlaF
VNAIELARQAYAPTNFPLKSDRSVEAQVIGKITARLRQASMRKDQDFANFVQALHENRKLWNALAVDVSDSDNELPASFRAQIFYLAEFTDIHSAKVLRGEAATDALIEVNTSILRGLSSGQDK